MKEEIQSLGDQGGHQLYPADPSVGPCCLDVILLYEFTLVGIADRRPALLTVLKSLLVSYSRLLDALLAPPPTPLNMEQPDWLRHVEWITIMAQNLMAAANDLRPVQVRWFLA